MPSPRKEVIGCSDMKYVCGRAFTELSSTISPEISFLAKALTISEQDEPPLPPVSIASIASAKPEGKERLPFEPLFARMASATELRSASSCALSTSLSTAISNSLPARRQVSAPPMRCRSKPGMPRWPDCPVRRWSRCQAGFANPKALGSAGRIPPG